MSATSGDLMIIVRPLLKWAGGKRQLLPMLRRFYPPAFRRYCEPFLGSGAVFFDLHNSGRLIDRQALLLDSNADLIGCYSAVRDRTDAVIAALRKLAAGHARHGAAHYYAVRDREFNPARRRLSAPEHGPLERYPAELAAMLIYLNRTGYNGLFRLNARGDFNVPAGRYAHPAIASADQLRRVAAALASPGVTLRCASFDALPPSADAGDFFYFDPPYAPTSSTSRFTAYTAGGFGPTEQFRLQQVIIALAARGSRILLSNSTAPEIARLYDGSDDAVRVGLKALQVPARRAINSHAGRRGPVSEYVITNIAPQPDGLWPGARRPSSP